MSGFGGRSWCVRRLRLAAAALAAFAACLNPQPDDNPLRRPHEPEAPAGNQSNPSVSAPDTDSLLFEDNDGKESPPSSPAITATEVPSSGGTSSADAGAPPPPDAGPDPGDRVEGDAGAAD